jgi:hypothetical protein
VLPSQVYGSQDYVTEINSLLGILLGTKRLEWAGLARVQGLRLGAPHDLATVMKYLSNSFQDTSLFVVLIILYVACVPLYAVFIVCARGTNYKCVTKYFFLPVFCFLVQIKQPGTIVRYPLP